MRILDCLGKTFGDLTVLERAAGEEKAAYWLCECVCGDMCRVRGSLLKRGAKTNCGCRPHPNAKGVPVQTTQGYLTILVHEGHPYYAMSYHNSGSNYILQHRLVMAEHLGRTLSQDEVVHHDNENKQDNRIENLVLMSQEEHTREHRRRASVSA